MKSNLEKWNYYLSIINDKTDKFINSQKEGRDIPEKYFAVYPTGKIVERNIFGVTYSHYRHRGTTYFTGKLPTRKDVLQLKAYSELNIPFSIDNIWFSYREIYGGHFTSVSSVSFSDITNQRGLFFTFDEAQAYSERVIEKIKEDTAFNEKHAKDVSYNYAANGYKFLGWQNGWKHEYYDEDGILCSISGKPSKSFGYSKENYPEYRKCIDAKHRRIEVHHNYRGTENTVSCPICKVYWKYDCGD